jgi:hypothetical protein
LQLLKTGNQNSLAISTTSQVGRTPLRWSDIDWIKPSIAISKGRVRGKEGLPKTKSSEREIPVIPVVASVLAELHKRSTKDLYGHVFTKKDGQPIDKHLDRIWARALRKAGLRHRPSYQLRHTFATLCIVKGFPLPYVAKLLGHSTMDTTIRHYAGWVDSHTEAHDTMLKSAFAVPSKSVDTRVDTQPCDIKKPAVEDDNWLDKLTSKVVNGADEGNRTPEYRDHNPVP